MLLVDEFVPLAVYEKHRCHHLGNKLEVVELLLHQSREKVEVLVHDGFDVAEG